MNSITQFERDMVSELPNLRLWCLKLTQRMADAEDLINDTIERAWKNRSSFAPGTNMRAWLFMIARNKFFTDRTRAKRMVQMPDGLAEAQAVAAGVLDRIELREVLGIMDTMPPAMRDVMLSVAEGYDYSEVAQRCGTAIGTVKSRVFRGRQFLTDAGMEG